jgi:hypothetical protein
MAGCKSSVAGVIQLPDFPGNIDWGLRLIYAGMVTSGHHANANEEP